MGEAITTMPIVSDVCIYPLKQIFDERGSVMHMMRSDSVYFRSFGEVYFSTIKKNVVKGWKRHRAMTQNFAVPVGEIRLVIWDSRPESKTFGEIQELQVGIDKYSLIQMPPMVWYSFKSIWEYGDSMIVNVASIPYDPGEVEILPIDSVKIPYSWDK